MARQYAPIYTSIWQDDDFKSLSSDAQRLYFLAISQPELSWCGVVSFTARRWATFASDSSARKVARSCVELVTAGFFLLDEETEELWVRGFIKHNVETQPKLRQAAQREYGQVVSGAIREAIAKAYEWVPPAQPVVIPKPPEQTTPESDVLGVGVQCEVSSTQQTSSQITPTPTPPIVDEEFIQGCRLVAERQCVGFVARGERIVDPEAWTAKRTANLAEKHAQLGMDHPDADREEIASLILPKPAEPPRGDLAAIRRHAERPAVNEPRPDPETVRGLAGAARAALHGGAA